jgi:hypothetical protein
MREFIYKNQDWQLLFNKNNNNELLHYRQQQEKSSSSNDKLFSVMKINEENPMKKRNGNDCDTIVRRVNEHAYIVSFDKLQQETEYHLRKSTLTDIHTDLVRNKENLVTNEGFIHIKEYALDGYECRCHEHNDLLNDEKINNTEHWFNYKLEF